MEVTTENITTIPLTSHEQGLLKALMSDLEEINLKSEKRYYIDWQDWHNEYSPERTDPCPDFYGYYTIRSSPEESIEIEMNLQDLDISLCLLYGYVYE